MEQTQKLPSLNVSFEKLFSKICLISTLRMGGLEMIKFVNFCHVPIYFVRDNFVRLGLN